MNSPTTGFPEWLPPHFHPNYRGKSKPQYEYPSLEDFHPLVAYAITISPNEVIRSDSLIECVTNIYCDILPLFKQYGCQFTLRPELSTQNQILHYHGTILFPTRDGVTHFYFYNIVKLKSVCTFVIKHIDEMDTWIRYCKKQRLHMKPFTTENNLRYKLTETDKGALVKPVKKRMPVDSDLDHGTPYQNTPSIISLLKK